MLLFYGNDFEGKSLFGRSLNKLLCEEPMSQGVRSRKEGLVDFLSSEFRKRKSSRPIKVLSLGCGPASEIQDLAKKRVDFPAVEWTLVDQDEEALSVAYDRGFRAFTDSDLDWSINCRQLSFRQLLQSSDMGLVGGGFDVIYCAGLFDYLRGPLASALARRLFSILVPGGTLVVGNAWKGTRNHWMVEFAGDWSLTYRNREEMLALIDGASGVDDANVEVEPTKSFCSLFVKKSSR